jgi:predicted dehydrogenase
MRTIAVAQYGTKHGHAAGKLAALRANPRVDVTGVFEPDEARRAALQQAGDVWEGLRWYEDEAELLDDPRIVAVASEGRNHESLAHTAACIAAGKHVWYDKPAGDDWERWQRVITEAEQRKLVLQLGYMFRYHQGFRRISSLAHEGVLGDIFAVRAHMSTSIPANERREIARHTGGILYDLGGHMLEQIVALLGRPLAVTSFLRADDALPVAGFSDNTLAVLSYPRAIATVDIAAMEPPPAARRFEVYGTRGSAIMEPFEPAGALRLCLTDAHGAFAPGEQYLPLPVQTRQELYDRELEAFLAAITGERPPDRSYAHELLVQETLLRATRVLPP